MGITIQFIPKNQSEEKSSIMLVAYHKLFKGGRFKYYFPPVEMKAWDRKKQRHKNDRPLNEQLQGIKLETEAIFHRQFTQDRQIISSDWMRQQIDKLIGKPVEIIKKKKMDLKYPTEFFDLWTSIIGSTRSGSNPIAKSTKQGKLNNLEWVREYSKDKGWTPSLFGFDRDFYFGFGDYLLENGIQSVGKHIKDIKAFLHECEERNIPVGQDFKKKFFKVSFSPREQTYLTQDEVDKILNLTLPKSLSDCRDTFVMACYCGLRHSDWNQIHPHNIVSVNGKEFLTLIPQKTKSAVRIPLHHVVKQIFQKHSNNPPRVLSNPNTNAYLKEIGQEAQLGKIFLNGEIIDKAAEICTHTARRSFATNGYLSGMPTQLIMTLTGHKKESSFKSYLKLGTEEMAQLASESTFFNDVSMKVAV